MAVTETDLQDCRTYCTIINSLLTPKSGKFPEELYSQYLPVDEGSLAERISDGVLLGYLLADIAPQCKRYLTRLRPCGLVANMSGTSLDSAGSAESRTAFVKRSNLTTVLTDMARTAGVAAADVSPNDIIELSTKPALSIVSRIVMAHLFRKLNASTHEGLILLRETDEPLEAFLRLEHEDILIRWVNYHLRNSPFNAEHPRRLEDFTLGLVDGEIFVLLLHQLFPKTIDAERVGKFNQLTHQTSRAFAVVEFLKQVGLEGVIHPVDILNCNPPLAIACFTHLFDMKTGLSPESGPSGKANK